MIEQFKLQLESIKFSHTIFALPFALIAALLCRRGSFPTAWEMALIVLAMVGARTWAMCVNRAVDVRIDAQNPRTAGRPLPAKQISGLSVWVLATCGASLFVLAAALLSQDALLCAVPVLLILASYSYTKRFTILCHFWLGLCLGLAPLGAWIALRKDDLFPFAMLSLTFAICFWVAGFDIIYATQDEDFDIGQKLHSIPARYGKQTALRIAQICHGVAAILFCYFGTAYSLGVAYFIGLCFVFVFMVAQHKLVKDPTKINFAFFNLNGWIAVTLLGVTALSLYLEKSF